MRTTRKRIKIRGRKMEQNMPYLKRLDELYENWIRNYQLSTVMVVEGDKLDYVYDLIDRLDVMQQIESIFLTKVFAQELKCYYNV